MEELSVQHFVSLSVGVFFMSLAPFCRQKPVPPMYHCSVFHCGMVTLSLWMLRMFDWWVLLFVIKYLH